MANPHESKSGSPIPGIVIGVVLMIGGMAVHRAVGRIEPVGIPLEPGKTVATIGVFMILFPVIKMFFLNPLNAAVGSRNQELERTFSEAESLRAEMGTLRKEYEARLAATEAQARETIQNQIREAQALRSSLRDEAQARADALVANAQNEVTAERTRLLSELRTHVTDLALAAAERVVGENMDTDRNRRIVDDFIANSDMYAINTTTAPVDN